MRGLDPRIHHANDAFAEKMDGRAFKWEAALRTFARP
jgi:hypothetical protein